MKQCSCNQQGYKKWFRVIVCVGLIASVFGMSYLGTGFNFRRDIFNITLPQGAAVLKHIHALITGSQTTKYYIRRNDNTSNAVNTTAVIMGSQKKNDIRPKNNMSNTTEKVILLKHIPAWAFHSIASKQLESCPFKCKLVKSGDITKFDAVIFNAVGYPERRPPVKPPGQVWVFFSLESPQFSSIHRFNSPEWKRKINWTMTYRSDSDIWYPYGKFVKKEKPTQVNYYEVTKSKSKLVALFVSHCNVPSAREKYVRELQKTIPVDVYGLCGSKKCPQSQFHKCMEMLNRDYKFYLSFENSLCYDYMTEKVFQYMSVGLVPIVRGGANYTKFLPPHSFINTADFKTPQKLGEYLLYLDKNHTAYVEYFHWKNHYENNPRPPPCCELCKRLYNPTAYNNLYDNVYSWWQDGTCRPPKDLYFGATAKS